MLQVPQGWKLDIIYIPGIILQYSYHVICKTRYYVPGTRNTSILTLCNLSSFASCHQWIAVLVILSKPGQDCQILRLLGEVTVRITGGIKADTAAGANSSQDSRPYILYTCSTDWNMCVSWWENLLWAMTRKKRAIAQTYYIIGKNNKQITTAIATTNAVFYAAVLRHYKYTTWYALRGVYSYVVWTKEQNTSINPSLVPVVSPPQESPTLPGITRQDDDIPSNLRGPGGQNATSDRGHRGFDATTIAYNT